jgi:hypothetical protein
MGCTEADRRWCRHAAADVLHVSSMSKGEEKFVANMYSMHT